MNRPVSPLLHDYKPSTTGSPEKPSSAIPWFAFGLGLPLIGIALMFALRGTAGDEAHADTQHVAATAVRTPPTIILATLDESDTVELDPPVSTDEAVAISTFYSPMLPPEPQFDTVSLAIRRGDTLDQLFRKHGLSRSDLAAIIKLPDAKQHLRILKPGDELLITHDDGSIVSVYRELGLTSALNVTRTDDGYTAEMVDRPIELRKRHAYGRIDSSLFESAAAAGLPDKLIMNLAGIFAWDVDFVLDIRTGDDYYLLYEEIYQDGEYVTDGQILAAEFNNDGRTHQAIRFVDNDGNVDYFTPEGDSVRKAFIRAPVDFSRISSNFNPRRRHPILNTIRAHKGVDYAAPRGDAD